MATVVVASISSGGVVFFSMLRHDWERTVQKHAKPFIRATRVQCGWRLIGLALSGKTLDACA